MLFLPVMEILSLRIQKGGSLWDCKVGLCWFDGIYMMVEWWLNGGLLMV